ncbi:hypothetical protein NPIL_689851 [Nephila pilipes]|uniref:Uncharacterized protein n=1 Tax=Nephila pilipes TaxID=299642 RepID=A0A8X6PDW7_NEPPI|nr:hypothetical protein NPIL_689851 [Nephila pilipes]
MENNVTDEVYNHLESYSKYIKLSRYLILQPLFLTPTSQKLSLERGAQMPPELIGTEIVIKTLVVFFHHDFKKIMDSKEEKISGFEMECATFFLSRSVLMCNEPSVNNFMLVTAFMSFLIYNYVTHSKCFRILHVCEYCFAVLFKRVFSIVFMADEDYEKLRLFCDEFVEHLTTDSMLNDLGNTPVIKNYMNLVNNCINGGDNSFSLSDYEVDRFESQYSKDMCLYFNESEISVEMEECTDTYIEIYEDNGRLLCARCYGKCYIFLAFINEFRKK